MSATAFQRMRREMAAKKAAVLKEKDKLEEMKVDELKEYAEKHNIDLGKSTSKNGILEKIKAAE